MLFVKLETNYAPVDVNLIKFLNRFEDFKNLVKYSKPPLKKHCMTRVCWECPIRGSCIENLLSRELGSLTGWFQTVAYLHNKLYCSQRECLKCSLKDFCLQDRVLRA